MNLRNKLLFFMAVDRAAYWVTLRGIPPLDLRDAEDDNIASLKSFGKAEHKYPDLWEGYTQLTYIESSHTQMIDTGYVLKDTDIVEIDYVLTNLTATGDKFICGSHVATGSNNGNWVETYGTGNRWYVRFGSTTSANANFSNSQASGTMIFKKGSFSVNGTQIATPAFTEMPSSNFTLFGRLSSGGLPSNTGAYVRISECRIRDSRNGFLTHKYVPCRQNSDGELGMMDAYSGEFFPNVGTGTFIAGDVVEPTPSNPVQICCNNGMLEARDPDGLDIYTYRRLKDITFSDGVYYASNVYLSGADVLRISFLATQYSCLCGCYSGAEGTDNYTIYATNGPSGAPIRYGSGVYRTNMAFNTRYDAVMSPTGITGVGSGATWTEEQFNCSEPFYIGWMANTTSLAFRGTIYGKIVVDNLCTWIPCKRISDGAIGYWDTYSNMFLENQGTGTPTTSGYETMPALSPEGQYAELTMSPSAETASLEMLLSIGDVHDEQQVIDGTVTRRVKAIALTGDEDWTAYNSWFRAPVLETSSNTTLLCTHFANRAMTNDYSVYKAVGSRYLQLRYDAITSVVALKAWLQQQFEDGNPVIVVFATASASTEYVTAQTLTTIQGDDGVSFSSAFLPDTEIEVTYKKRG